MPSEAARVRALEPIRQAFATFLRVSPDGGPGTGLAT
jgi:hypothetical protein